MSTGKFAALMCALLLTSPAYASTGADSGSGGNAWTYRAVCGAPIKTIQIKIVHSVERSSCQEAEQTCMDFLASAASNEFTIECDRSSVPSGYFCDDAKKVEQVNSSSASRCNSDPDENGDIHNVGRCYKYVNLTYGCILAPIPTRGLQ